MDDGFGVLCRGGGYDLAEEGFDSKSLVAIVLVLSELVVFTVLFLYRFVFPSFF